MPPALMIAYVARQLDIDPAVLDAYADRSQTRREQLDALMRRHHLHSFGRDEARVLVGWLTPIAQTNRKPVRLLELLLDELRRQRILLPAPRVLGLVVHHALTRAERITHQALIQGMPSEQIVALDGLLATSANNGIAPIAWMRQAPASPTARNLLGLTERMKALREIGLDRDREAGVPAVVFDALANGCA